ncbi:MAG: polymer-forming cytoskeletal protein [Spirochaetia bacterium]|nr:polymer-forming cytoskeletal protein [Spirochaetia bacterium]
MAAKKEKPVVKLNYTTFHKKVKMNGILTFSKPLKICGEFEGSITGSSILYVDSGAKIKAHIETPHVIVQGEVIGNINATEKVELHSGCTVIGNIRSPNLEIEDGVIFEGQCEMKQRPVSVPA